MPLSLSTVLVRSRTPKSATSAPVRLATMTKHDKPLTPTQIAAVKDQDIDFSDIPELDDEFWRNAELVEPDRTEQITLRVKRSVLAYFRASGEGYQSRMNDVLESYVRAQGK